MRSMRHLPSALALAICSVLGTSQAMAADLTTGAITGQAKAGTTISILSKDTGLKRELTVDNSGRYSFSSLPSGNYVVTVNGREVELRVSAGVGTTFNVEEVERVEISGSRVSPIDTSTAESTYVFSADQLLELPGGRDMVSVALLAPTTVAGDPSFGGAAFAGSSVAENGFYIDGFDVTNARNMRSFANIPADAIGETAVKVGGYGAEYGRSLGGVVSQSIKRGTNAWKFGGSVYYSPQSWRKRNPDVVTSIAEENTPTGQSRLLAFRQDEEDRITYNAYASGPIVEDKLFVFGLVEGRVIEGDDYNAVTSSHYENTSPKYIVRLDWNITDDHILTATAINNRTVEENQAYANPVDPNDPQGRQLAFTGRHGEKTDYTEVESGGEISIFKYTGHITDDITISAMRGEVESWVGFQTPTSLPGGECDAVYDGRVAGTLTPMGCWNPAQLTIRDPSRAPDSDDRIGTRVDLEWMVGDHTLRAGWDEESLTSSKAGYTYSGSGTYYRYYRITNPNGGSINRVPGFAQGTEYYRTRTAVNTSAEFEAKNEAFYIEDSWQITNDLMIYAGFRREAFANYNATGATIVDAQDQDAPRLGVSWDVNGDGLSKLSATFGRYYIPVATRTNIDLSGFEGFVENYYLWDGKFDPATGKPLAQGTLVGAANVTSGTVTPADPREVAAQNLEPMYQDELTVHYQRDFGNGWSGTAGLVYREVKNGMDDTCQYGPFMQWAKDQGYTKAKLPAHCVIINPGRDVTRLMDIDGTGNKVLVTVPASYFNLPEYEREYKALTFEISRQRRDGWWMNASYTWSHNEGNMEGYVNSTLNQGEQPGISQDFDHFLFEDGAYGDLPNDRRHVIKVYGAYEVTDELTLSSSLNITSGRPVNCQGYIPLDNAGVHPTDKADLERWGPSSFYCLNEETGKAELHQRGDMGRTPWVYNVDLGIRYTPAWLGDHVTFNFNVTNLFDFDEVVEYSETHDRWVDSRDDVRVNPNYMKPLNFQARRAMSLSMHVRF